MGRIGGWLQFKGKYSYEFGCKIESLPSECAPKRRYQTAEVNGRSGVLHIDTGTYEPVTLTATLNLAGFANVREIMDWLTGNGELVLSDCPDYCRRSFVIDGNPFKRRGLSNGERWDSFTVKFQCDPFLYESDPESFLLDTNPKT
ncbi:MAG: hypothetical protein RSD95_16530, partial [Clostridia bacterium]